jgi:hypothetical protein
MDNEQPWNYSYKYTYSWTKRNWVEDWNDDALVRLLTDLTTKTVMDHQDLKEKDVKNSGCALAKTMLENIGIKCPNL